MSVPEHWFSGRRKESEVKMEELLMLSGKRVKIIKRGDSQAGALYERPTEVPDDQENSKRDTFTIVTGWVSELRRKKAQEAAHGFQSVFGKAG
jgi:hypothetical protein